MHFMRGVHRLRMALRALLGRARLEREMREEMEAHLARSTERLMARGLAPEAAERAARREFGNEVNLQEQARDARGTGRVASVIADVRFGLRHFGRTRFTTLTMVVLLALGIGINSALFTLIYSMVNMPTPGIPRDETLVRIRGIDARGGPGRVVGREFSYPEFLDYAAQTSLFSAVTAWTSADVVVAAGSDPEILHSGAATYVTADYFRVLGVRLVLGTGLPGAESGDRATALAGVISHALWDRLFGKAPDVVGRTVIVNDMRIMVTGVAPKRFAGARTGGSQVRVWLPLEVRSLVQRTSGLALGSPDSTLFGLAARLVPGVEPAHTLPLVEAIAQRAAAQSTRWRSSVGISADVVTLTGDNYFPPSGSRPELNGRAVTLLIPLLILLIPCANASVLLVGLGVARRREIAVRLSLGAARHRIVRQLVTESVMLALAAGGLGLAVIAVLLRTAGARIPDLQLVLHWPVFVFTFGVAVLTGILFGTSPALHATRVPVAEVLKHVANAMASARSRLQSGLVVAQIALTLPLLLGLAALILELRSDLARLPTSLFGDRIVEVSFNTNPRYGVLDAEREAMLLLLQERFVAIPGVEAVVPHGVGDGDLNLVVHPSDRLAGVEYSQPSYMRTHAAPPGYFALMGLPFVSGRDFDRADREGGRTLVITADLARQLWGGADPIGRRISDAGSGAEFVVVGVVDERRAGPGEITWSSCLRFVSQAACWSAPVARPRP